MKLYIASFILQEGDTFKTDLMLQKSLVCEYSEFHGSTTRQTNIFCTQQKLYCAASSAEPGKDIL